MPTIIPGADASITVTGATYKFFAVGVNLGRDLIPVDHFDSDYHERIGGLKDLSGTISCYVSKDGSDTDPFADLDGVSMTITFAVGCSIAFTATVGQRSISTDPNSAVIATYSFAKTGGSAAPTTAWDETS